MTGEISENAIKRPSQASADLPDIRDCTIIVPTYNQPSHLHRLLHYYDEMNTPLSMIIADSSHDNIKKINRENISSCKSLDIRLIEYHSSIHPYRKVIDADKLVSTPFVANCADDDFLILHGTQRAMQFLSLHPEYGVAQGQYFAFQQSRSTPAEIKFNGNTGYYPLSPIDASTPVQRLQQMANARNPLFFAVYKTPLRRKINTYWLESGVIPEEGELDPFVYSEIYHKMLTAIFTRIASLQFLYYIRDRSLRRVQSSDKDWDYGFWLGQKEKECASSRQYTLFRTSIASHLCTESGISKEEALQLADDAFKRYQSPRTVQSRFQRTTEIAGSILSRYRIGNVIRKKYQDIFGSHYRNHISTYTQSTFPGNPPEGSQEYLEYARIVKTVQNWSD